MLSEEPATIAISFGPAGVGDFSDDQRRQQRVHFARHVVELQLPEDLQILDVVCRQRRLVALPAGALHIAAVGEPVRGRLGAGNEC